MKGIDGRQSMKLNTRSVTVAAWVSQGMDMADSSFTVETAAVEVGR